MRGVSGRVILFVAGGLGCLEVVFMVRLDRRAVGWVWVLQRGLLDVNADIWL
jgi:hypothetical protein